jgi:hypothetical protein
VRLPYYGSWFGEAFMIICRPPQGFRRVQKTSRIVRASLRRSELVDRTAAEHDAYSGGDNYGHDYGQNPLVNEEKTCGRQRSSARSAADSSRSVAGHDTHGLTSPQPEGT